ncbi:MAG TPA: DUF1365 domain-containing protein, partial [Acidimicrobiia bacterium]
TRVAHERTERVAHGFTYRHDLWLVDLDDLPRLPRVFRSWLRFDARDHFGDSRAGSVPERQAGSVPERQSSIRADVDAYLARQGITCSRVLMLANPRSLGYVFNPLTVFWCYGARGELRAVIAEVHNTYRGRHCYLLRPDVDGRATVDKKFYVSPFFTVDGVYEMRFSEPAAALEITIDLWRAGRPVPAFRASVTGCRLPRTRGSLVRAVLAQPVVSRRVMVLIRWQGVRLWLRRVPVVPRPRPLRHELHHEGVPPR